jgi:hypothetical protein
MVKGAFVAVDIGMCRMAERVGFEPTVPVLPGHSLSRRALSTAQTPLRGSKHRLSEALPRLNLRVDGAGVETSETGAYLGLLSGGVAGACAAGT